MSKLLSLISIFLAYTLVADRTTKTIPDLHVATPVAEQRRQTLLYPIDSGRPMIGMIAPDFQLQDGYGKNHRLSSHRGKENVVLVFYPQDFTDG